MGQQAGTFATWRNPNKRISRDLSSLWDSTRANAPPFWLAPVRRRWKIADAVSDRTMNFLRVLTGKLQLWLVTGWLWFRFNRRTSRSRGLLFYRLLTQA